MTEQVFTDGASTAPPSTFTASPETSNPEGATGSSEVATGQPQPDPAAQQPTPEPQRSPGGLGSAPQGVNDTPEQVEARSRLLEALADAPTGSLPHDKLEHFLERRVLGHPVSEVAEAIGVDTETALEAEEQLSEWLLAEEQLAVRQLVADDHRLWRFLFNYQRGT